MLKVKEAMPKDVGHAIARVSPEDMAELAISEGQIVEIEGRRRTPVRILSCDSELVASGAAKGVIQVDGVTRDNAQVSLDDRVKIHKTTHHFAGSVTLRPLTSTALLEKERDAVYIRSLLEGLPVTKDDRVRTNLFGSRICDFRIVDTTPSGTVIISKSTYVNVEKQAEGEKKAKITYEDIGGLGPQIQRIREMIELPLRFPQVFDRLGVQPPKGVLLYGPPGTGKTVIARAVAAETDVYFTHISGPEVIGKFSGRARRD